MNDEKHQKEKNSSNPFHHPLTRKNDFCSTVHVRLYLCFQASFFVSRGLWAVVAQHLARKKVNQLKQNPGGDGKLEMEAREVHKIPLQCSGHTALAVAQCSYGTCRIERAGLQLRKQTCIPGVEQSYNNVKPESELSSAVWEEIQCSEWNLHVFPGVLRSEKNDWIWQHGSDWWRRWRWRRCCHPSSWSEKRYGFGFALLYLLLCASEPLT